MQATLIENNENGRIAYDSLILSDPKALSVLNSKIAMKIVKTLADTPCCAIDVARRLKIHEQKIYYHLRNLERAGIVYTISQERRHGMIAKIYSVVSPVVATKLFERGVEVRNEYDLAISSSSLLNFFTPFIDNGKLNAKIILGDPAPHGKFDDCGMEGAHVSDLFLFFGRFLKEFNFPNYKLDTEVMKEDLEENLILIGNNRTNTVIEKMNSNLPVYFDSEKPSLISSITKTTYRDDRVGLVLKARNPFNSEKMILLIGGVRTRGIRSAIIYVLKHLANKFKDIKSNQGMSIVVQGLDRDGDKIIDDIKILES